MVGSKGVSSHHTYILHICIIIKKKNVSNHFITYINKYKYKLHITLSLNDNLTISASDGFDNKIIFKNIQNKCLCVVHVTFK